MRNELMRQISRYSALALLIILVGTTYLAIIEPLLGIYRANEDEIAAEREKLARFLSVAGYENEIDGLIKRASARAPANQFLQGNGEAIVVAELQTRLKTFAQSKQVVLSSARTARDQTIEGITYYGVRLNLFGQPDNVNGFINTVETSLPFLFLESTHLRAAHRLTDNVDEQIRLDAQLDIYGAIAPDSPALNDPVVESKQ